MLKTKYKDMTTRQKIKANLVLVAIAAAIAFMFSVMVPIIRGDGMVIEAEGFDAKIGIEIKQVKQ